MNRILFAGIAILGLLAVAGFAAARPWADATDAGQKAPAMVSAELADFVKAVESGDYAKAKELSEKYGFAKQWMANATEEQFKKFAELREAVEAGDTAKAAELRKQLEQLGWRHWPRWWRAYVRGYIHGFVRGFRMGMHYGCPGMQGGAPAIPASVDAG